MGSSEQKVFTVTEITRALKATIEGSDTFSRIWVKGEIYNLTLHSSGHIYFSLKDDNAVISAVFFKSYNAKLAFRLEEGMSVLAFGNITVFEKRGSYQISVFQLRLEGIGELQKRIDQLKKKLLEEGIFDKSRKRPIPLLPKRIGVVTSPTGAAVRDIIKVALRRFPNIGIVIAPAKVQGDDAVESIVRGIRELNRPAWRIDVIIAGRGGGSFEDLMPFNEETVVRAFAGSRVPIISAVGHQIDHPLCDDAADLAAPTPSAAAEMAVPMKQELIDEIEYLAIRAANALDSKLREAQMRIDAVLNRPVFLDPMEIVRDRESDVSGLGARLAMGMRQAVSGSRNGFLAVPDIRMLMKSRMEQAVHSFTMALHALDQLSPVSVLRRGYAIAMDVKENVIRSIDRLRIGDRISLHLKDGVAGCSVESVTRGGHFGTEKGSKK